MLLSMLLSKSLLLPLVLPSLLRVAPLVSWGTDSSYILEAMTDSGGILEGLTDSC